jgi:solute carrier family 25 (mitochondrial S-adenosylmethionine transporter), member 26
MHCDYDLCCPSYQNGASQMKIVSGLKSLYAEGGIRVLFSGVQPRVMWISIGGFVFFGAYEKVKTLLLEN